MIKGAFPGMLLLLLNTITANAQLSIKSKASKHFILPGLHITLSNNFIIDGYKYTPNYISLPFKEEHFTIYGQQLIMSAFKEDSLVKTGYYEGAFFIDSSWRDMNAFPLEAIQERVSRNGTLLRDWQYINRLPSFEDSAVTYKADSTKLVKSYWLLKDSLRIGDSLLVELRKDTMPPFFRLYAKRENAYTQPFLMTYYNDTTLTELSFIRKILLDHRQKIYNEVFYDDWPGPGLPLHNSPVPANARIAFYFPEGHTRQQGFHLFLPFNRGPLHRHFLAKNRWSCAGIRITTQRRLQPGSKVCGWQRIVICLQLLHGAIVVSNHLVQHHHMYACSGCPPVTDLSFLGREK